VHPGFEAPTEDLSREPRVHDRIELERIAELVYQMMLRDLAIELERGGWERGSSI
jgi:hypothetical protein